MKNRISSGFDFQDEYRVIEINSLLPDYGLCYRMNKKLKAQFSRKKDLRVYRGEKKADQVFSFYEWKPEIYHDYYLLWDNQQQSVLMPSFYLLIKGFFTKEQVLRLCDQISLADQIINCHEIDFRKMQNTRIKKLAHEFNLIVNDLEYHLIELNKRESPVVNKAEKGNKKVYIL